MNYEQKIDYILQIIKLGIALERAYILTECTEDERKQLNNDANFLRGVKVCSIIEEKRLLDLFEQGMDIAVSRGNTAPVQWKLSKVNPERWGNNQGSFNEEKSQKAKIYLPNNGRNK